MRDFSVRKRDERLPQTGKSIAWKGIKCYENDSYSTNGARELNNSGVERSDPRINSNRFAKSKTEDNVCWNIILDSYALEHAVTSASFLSCIKQIPSTMIELADGCTVEASTRGIIVVNLGDNVSISCTAFFDTKVKIKYFILQQTWRL